MVEVGRPQPGRQRRRRRRPPRQVQPAGQPLDGCGLLTRRLCRPILAGELAGEEAAGSLQMRFAAAGGSIRRGENASAQPPGQHPSQPDGWPEQRRRRSAANENRWPPGSPPVLLVCRKEHHRHGEPRHKACGGGADAVGRLAALQPHPAWRCCRRRRRWEGCRRGRRRSAAVLRRCCCFPCAISIPMQPEGRRAAALPSELDQNNLPMALLA